MYLRSFKQRTIRKVSSKAIRKIIRDPQGPVCFHNKILPVLYFAKRAKSQSNHFLSQSLDFNSNNTLIPHNSPNFYRRQVRLSSHYLMTEKMQHFKIRGGLQILFLDQLL